MKWKRKETTQNFLGSNSEIQRAGADGPTVYPTHPDFKRMVELVSHVTWCLHFLLLKSSYALTRAVLGFCFLHTQRLLHLQTLDSCCPAPFPRAWMCLLALTTAGSLSALVWYSWDNVVLFFSPYSNGLSFVFWFTQTKNDWITDSVTYRH